MKQELIMTGKTVDDAVSAAAASFGVTPDQVAYEVLEQPKKGFLGIGETPAKVKVTYSPAPQEIGLAFLKTMIADMELEVDIRMTPNADGKNEYLVAVSGKDAGTLIGHHGETLDALQYLTNLAANRRDEDSAGGNYTRICLDVENYRAKREETLRRLAKRMADKALKYRRNVTLEPMSAYERRIIHSELQSVAGVTTSSIGSDNNRRVVIYVENAASRGPHRGSRRDNYRGAKSSADTVKETAEKTEENKPLEEDTYEEDESFSFYALPKDQIKKRARFDDSLPEYHAGDALREDIPETADGGSEEF